MDFLSVQRGTKKKAFQEQKRELCESKKENIRTRMCAQKYRNGRNDNKANGICHPSHQRLPPTFSLLTKAFYIDDILRYVPVIHIFLLYLRPLPYTYLMLLNIWLSCHEEWKNRSSKRRESEKKERYEIENYIFPSICCMGF